ncbi:Pre-rRNA-processing protein TSR2 homolog [Anthophora plagiata]
MTDAKDFFLSVTQRIFSNWTALRMAVEHGMGAKERAVEFCPYITEVMYMNEGLNSSEIASELEDYMDEHFNTELQDDSATQVAEELLKFYRYSVENNASVLAAELEKVPPLQSWLVTSEPVRKVRNTDVMENDSSEDDEETPSEMEVIDEWTEVRSRRKR